MPCSMDANGYDCEVTGIAVTFGTGTRFACPATVTVRRSAKTTTGTEGRIRRQYDMKPPRRGILRRARSSVAAVRADGREQLVEGDRLLDVLVGLHPPGALPTVVGGGHADHGDVGVALVGQLPAPELVASHDRHHQIEQNHRRARVM